MISRRFFASLVAAAPLAPTAARLMPPPGVGGLNLSNTKHTDTFLNRTGAGFLNIARKPSKVQFALRKATEKLTDKYQAEVHRLQHIQRAENNSHIDTRMAVLKSVAYQHKRLRSGELSREGQGVFICKINEEFQALRSMSLMAQHRHQYAHSKARMAYWDERLTPLGAKIARLWDRMRKWHYPFQWDNSDDAVDGEQDDDMAAKNPWFAPAGKWTR